MSEISHLGLRPGYPSGWWAVLWALCIWTGALLAFDCLFAPGKPQPAATELSAQLVELPPPSTSPEHTAPRPAPEMPAPRAVAHPADKTPVNPAPQHATPEPSPAKPQPSQERPADTSNKTATGDILAARALFHPLPQLPDSLRMEIMHVVIVARFEIAVDGSTRVTLVSGTPDPRINQSVLNTLQTWRFFPALKNGQPQPSVQDIRIHLDVE